MRQITVSIEGRLSDIYFYNYKLHVSFSVLEAIDDGCIIESDKTMDNRQLSFNAETFDRSRW